MLLFLMASGLTLIFSMMGVLNFAHASFYMLGAFFGFQIGQIVGFWPAFVIAPVLVGGIGALVERYGSAPRAPARPGRRAVVHVRARLHHRGAGADGLGQGAGRLSRARLARLPGLHDILHQLSRLQDVRASDRSGDLRRAVRRAQAHPDRAHHPGLDHPCPHGGDARPQRAAGVHAGVRRRHRACRRSPA